ncbi:arylsulfatase [Devosia insulae DS-56]|uniref:Arylsulfatase n=1 Tax=Devosia insulae DS-56 TaxID=1116389 RepID=A0A1E5XU18_9HYPH|nr:sulfatase-like hydrolase/transferase [Devosia insulae]OEO32056.1 arylsulfatase [Devosia insulae DS-56]
MTRRPNIIVFFTDQQRWDTVGAHGSTMGATPNFDRLAESGMLVRNSFTCQPVCGPARSILQTGKYPTMTGCFRNSIALPRSEKTLAHHFTAAGYDTAYIGKWHLADHEPVPEEERGGYGEWLASNILEFTSYAYDTVMYDNDNQPVRLPGYRVDALTDAAIRYLDRPHDKPFFLFVSYLEPHHQNQTDDYPAPAGYEERMRQKMVLPGDLVALGGTAEKQFPGYMGQIAKIDEAYGRLHDALTSLKLADDTVVMFTSDHGNHFKTRNGEYKRSCHEASIRVPTLFTGPGFDGRGAHDGMVSLIDLPPTLLDAAGVEPPAHMQGGSILRREAGDGDDMFIQVSEEHVGRALRTRRWKYEVIAPDGDGWNDIGSALYREAFLYDLEADPHELDNLVAAPEHAGIRAELRGRLIARMQQAGETVPEIAPRE